MADHGILATLVIGFIAGWLAGHVVRGAGLGIVGDVVVGILGAFIGGWLLPRLHIHLGSGTIATIVNATIGAVLLLFLIRLVQGGGWRSRWGPRW